MSDKSEIELDGGFKLTHMVQAQRGLSDLEIEIFLATGQLPDLSQPPLEYADETPDDAQIMSEEDAEAWLSGAPLTASAFYDFNSSHGVSPLYEEVMRPKVPATITFNFDPHQPRDNDGRWSDDVDVDADVDFDDDDEYGDDDDEEFGANDGEDITTDLSAFTHEWTPQQQRAAYDYSDHHYEEINAYLDGGESGDVSSTAATTIRELRDMMRPTPQDVVTYRGLSLDAFGPDTTHENLPDILAGRTISNRRFTSTSFSKNVIENHYSSAVLFEINVPKGTPAVYIGDMTANESNDFELVIGDGTKMKITDVTRSGQYQTIVRAEVIT